MNEQLDRIEQGSAGWHAFRKRGLGSSDAPIIMGVSPWKTPYQLWEEKTSPVIKDEKNWAQIRGNEMEPLARANYELAHNIEMPPKLAVHSEHDFLRASLDGYNEELKMILEIKCPGHADHSEALAGRVPEKYQPQILHQLLVTGAEKAHYYSFDGICGALVEVLKDDPNIQERMEELLKSEIEFWELVQSKTPPPFSEKDFVPIEDASLLSQIALWKKKKIELQELEESADILRRSIESMMTHPRSVGGGVKITKIRRVGAVQYANIPALKGLDLDAFRKPGTEFYKFDIEKEPTL